jgi:hypothetical protein
MHITNEGTPFTFPSFLPFCPSLPQIVKKAVCFILVDILRFKSAQKETFTRYAPFIVK